MANGDAAAAAGLAVFPPTQDHGQGYDNDNIRGDELAEHIINGTHTWRKITDKPATFPPQDDSVDTRHLRDRAVTLAKLANNSVDTPQLRNGAVTFEELGEGAVTASRIRDGSIQLRHMTHESVGWDELTADVRDRINDTSSIRYKEDVTDAALDVDAVLALRPVTYHRRDAASGTRELGLIAEEVQAAGLEDLVVYRGGLVDGVRYQVLAVALLELVKHQHTQLEALAARLDVLEAPPVEPTDPTTPEEA